MDAIARSGSAVVAGICDPSAEMREAAAAAVPGAEVCESFDDLLALDLDGLVIATPSALHAEQSISALQRGLAVFCQKPLGRTAAEVRRVVNAAKDADRLLGVDLSYRCTEGMMRIHELIDAGDIGRVYAVDTVFHNAYGPDKEWFYDPARSGGGCVMDLGIHLVDLALWSLDFPTVENVTSRLFAAGDPLPAGSDRVEDYATARMDLEDGQAVQLACSWNLPAGREAVISATYYGTEGALSLQNVNGSFYDFEAHRYRGTNTETLVSPPDEWGGRAAVRWAKALAGGAGFDCAVEHVVEVADVLDRIYQR